MKDLPGMTDVDASLLYFCGLVKRHNKVALTGECADEIFGLGPARTPGRGVFRGLREVKPGCFLAQPKDYGKPWFGQLMAGPQMLAYFLQVNAWMEDYGL